MARSKKAQALTDMILDIFKLSGQLIFAGDEIANEVGLTSARWKVLGALGIAEKPLTVSQIAQNMGQTRQSVQRLVDAMTDKGFLELKENPYHKTSKLVQLTKKGVNTYNRLEEIQTPWATELANEFSQGDLDAALSVIKKLSEKLEN